MGGDGIINAGRGVHRGHLMRARQREPAPKDADSMHFRSQAGDYHLDEFRRYVCCPLGPAAQRLHHMLSSSRSGVNKIWL